LIIREFPPTEVQVSDGPQAPAVLESPTERSETSVEVGSRAAQRTERRMLIAR